MSAPHHPPHVFHIAVVDSNILAGLGLQQILRRIIPTAEVSLFSNLLELQASGCEEFVHFFVASRIYFEHTQFFRERRQQSIVLVAGEMQIHGVPTLNVCQSEQHIARAVMGLRQMGHPAASAPAPSKEDSRLSPREVEVARLLAKGCINKEIADALSISPTTVISHRKNIMEKLHARSLADITIHAVMNGLVDIGEL